jgi:hypothetical protein
MIAEPRLEHVLVQLSVEPFASSRGFLPSICPELAHEQITGIGSISRAWTCECSRSCPMHLPYTKEPLRHEDGAHALDNGINIISDVAPS